jgi:hypothetical protein
MQTSCILPKNEAKQLSQLLVSRHLHFCETYSVKWAPHATFCQRLPHRMLCSSWRRRSRRCLLRLFCFWCFWQCRQCRQCRQSRGCRDFNHRRSNWNSRCRSYAGSRLLIARQFVLIFFLYPIEFISLSAQLSLQFGNMIGIRLCRPLLRWRDMVQQLKGSGRKQAKDYNP